jgi:hypothetical protein
MANLKELSESLGIKSFSMPNITSVEPYLNINPALIDIPDQDEEFRAEAYYKRLAEYVIDFEKSLEEDKEVGVRLVTFGETVTIHVEDIGFYNPRLICFYGIDTNGNKVQLIQHVNQINFLLIALKREKDRPRVGFKLTENLIEKEKDIEK